MSSRFFHTHVHSEFSTLDALAQVEPMVRKAALDGQPAMALTDHGNMSGTVQLYKAARKYDMKPYPGLEGYFVPDGTENKDAPRYHIGLLALTFEGYQGLVWLSSESHKRENFHRFPRFDLSHLATLAEMAGNDIAILTGCYFGYVQQSLVNSGVSAAENVIAMYGSLFPNTYVELQNHNIDHPGGQRDMDIVNSLVGMANKLGLPYIATQDAHYLDQNDKPAHEMMKRAVYGGAEDEFPGDSFHLASGDWVAEHYPPDIWSEALNGYDDLLSKHNLSLPALDKYKFHVPVVSNSPMLVLKKLCRNAMKKRGLTGSKAHEERLTEELSVISDLGVANYLLKWHKVITWCTDSNIMVEARGSASGSLVNYLLGVTQLDPIEEGLMFERFLSRDRIKPPDIDLDVEDVNRPRVVAMIKREFSTIHIGTYAGLGTRVDQDGVERGSVVISYIMGLKKQGKPSHMIKTLDDVKQYYPQDYPALKRLARNKARKSYGVHAAGLLLDTQEQPIHEYVPTMLVASSNTTVTQFTMDDVEEFGYLKDDILGVKYLAILRRAQELIGRPDPLDLTWIPRNDPLACQIVRQGRPNTGVFQFDGYTMTKGGRQLKVRNTNDFIIAGALFRPALTKTGMDQEYMRRRFDKQYRDSITYQHPIFEKNLKSTYGIVLYQEQVIQIMRDLGMDIAGINVFFKMVKDSGLGSGERNAKRVKEVQGQFADICKAAGITDVKAAWALIEGYVQYGFNKAHSAAYGVRGYRGAYLKMHYPLEFHTALLEHAGPAKERDYVRETRHMGIRVLPPDVNISGSGYTIDRKRKAIRRGLSSIKGIGGAAATAIEEVRNDGGEFSDIEDFIDRVPARAASGGKLYLKDGTFSGNLEVLRIAGALESLGVER